MPRVIIVFFVKAAILFIVWKMLYILWLRPLGILDAPLTSAVGASTVAVLNLFADQANFKAVRSFPADDPEEDAESGGVVDIFRNGENTLRVATACNGLEIMILYAGFLFCFPGAGSSRRWSFLGIGLAIIFLLNIIRCALLVWIFLRFREYLDFSHHFVFTFIVYSCVFFLWYKYARFNPRMSHGSHR
ncbi:MAG TPA: archaeosortase/exosortase family protein [Puia sp.]